jgi:hypothetical protein
MAGRTAGRAAFSGGVVVGLVFLLGPVLHWMPYSTEGLVLTVVAWLVVTAYIFLVVRRITRRRTDDPS